MNLAKIPTEELEGMYSELISQDKRFLEMRTRLMVKCTSRAELKNHIVNEVGFRSLEHLDRDKDDVPK